MNMLGFKAGAMKVAGTIKVANFSSAHFEKGRLSGFCNPHVIKESLKVEERDQNQKRFEDAADFKDGKRPQIKE